MTRLPPAWVLICLDARRSKGNSALGDRVSFPLGWVEIIQKSQCRTTAARPHSRTDPKRNLRFAQAPGEELTLLPSGDAITVRSCASAPGAALGPEERMGEFPVGGKGAS